MKNPYERRSDTPLHWSMGLVALGLLLLAFAAVIDDPEPTADPGPVETAEADRPDACAVHRADLFRAVRDLTTAVTTLERRAMMEER